MSKKPEESSSTKQLKKDWEQNTKFLNNISAFPEDWYKRDTTNIYSTRSAANTNRPNIGDRSQTLNLPSNATANKEDHKKYEESFEKDD